jgi:DNA polymerase-3 subunit epsilon
MPTPLTGSFTALDFETADYGADSACSLALVRVEGTRIVGSDYLLIRPPRRRFVFTYIHGLTWTDVAGEPAFAEHWPRIQPWLDGADFVAAHNAAFDRKVLCSCAAAAGIALPQLKFQCTVQLARAAWKLRPANLPAVCKHLKIPLKHHDARSDAEACAKIIIASREQGVAYDRFLRDRMAWMH